MMRDEPAKPRPPIRPRRRHVHADDLRGLGRLTIDAIVGITGLVETMHHNISRAPPPLGRATQKPTTGITGFVYRSIRGVTRLVGGGIDIALATVGPALGKVRSTPRREAVLAALNGVLGDHLAESRNPLAIRMTLRRRGRPLAIDKRALAEAVSRPRGRILLVVHGLCMNDLQWTRNGHDHAARLAADAAVSPRLTPLYLHYNSGRHVSLNGRDFSALIASLVDAWPVPVTRIDFLAHSMGGLVTRSAIRYAEAAGHDWRARVGRIVFLGTPHDGAPLERGGHWVDLLLDGSPYTAAFSRLGKIRSAGITDLRHGSVVDEDWGGKDRFAPSTRARVKRHFVPLPAGVACFAVAASIAGRAGSLGDSLVGDGLVPVRSALGMGSSPATSLGFPATRRWVGHGLNHLDLLDSPAVYRRLQRWLA